MVRLAGRAAAIVASAPSAISCSPSPVTTSTGRSGCASARPRPSIAAAPIAPHSGRSRSWSPAAATSHAVPPRPATQTRRPRSASRARTAARRSNITDASPERLGAEQPLAETAPRRGRSTRTPAPAPRSHCRRRPSSAWSARWTPHAARLQQLGPRLAGGQLPRVPSSPHSPRMVTSSTSGPCRIRRQAEQIASSCRRRSTASGSRCGRRPAMPRRRARSPPPPSSA